MSNVTDTQIAALVGSATPVPWAPYEQILQAHERARDRAGFYAICAVRGGRILPADRVMVAQYDAIVAAMLAREAAILAAVA